MENVAHQPSNATPLSLFVNEEPTPKTIGPVVKTIEPATKTIEALAKAIEPTSKAIVDNPVEKNEKPTRIEWVLSPEVVTPVTPAHQEKIQTPSGASNNSPASAASGGYLARPSNIYAEEPRSQKESNPEHTPVKEPVLNTIAKDPSKEEESSPDMQLVFREDIPAADEPRAHQAQVIPIANVTAEDPAMQDDADDPKRRAADRINKLRNLSFNINAADPNNEFETVPAYIRRNLELYNTISNVENFYSNYEVKTDDNNNTEISTINTFLDGKRPD
jgi:cell division protein FtsZ